MKVVITGSTGLVGRALTRQLQEAGHECIPLRRPEWDGERDVAPAHLLAGCEAVIHLAGENVAAERWTEARKRRLLDSRVKSARHLKAGLEAAGCKPKLFLSASGIGVFGDRGDEILTEHSRPGDDFLARLCVEWEAAAEAVGASRTVMARFGAVLSSDGGFLEKVVPMFRRFGASRLGSGRQWFAWIHLQDCVRILLRMLADESLSGAVNVVAPHPLTNSEMTEELRRRIAAFRGPPVPPFALRILYGQLSEALLGSQRALPEKLERIGYEWKFPTFKAALDDLL